MTTTSKRLLALDDRGDDTEGEFWRDVRKAKQEKRASNRKGSAGILKEAGHTFTSHNSGAHLVVQANGHTVDFWPGTGRWTTRGFRFTLQGRGVRNLLQHLKETA